LLLHASAHHFQHHVPVSRFLLMSRTRLPRRTTRFPYTTLFRSRQMQDFKNETRGALLRQKAPLHQPAEFYNKRGAARCAKSNGCPSPGSPRHFPIENNFCFAAEVPLSSTFKILNLSAGDCRPDESRKPKLYLKSLSWRAGMWRR